jgi:hypothetical protein
MPTNRRKVVAWLAWSLCLLCVGLVVGALLLWLLNGRALIEFVREGDGAVAVLVVSFSVVGALIVSHRPENTIGWIFCAAALFQALSEFGLEYATYALITRTGALPLGAEMSWLADWIWAPGLGLILVFLPLFFPDGRRRAAGGRWPGSADLDQRAEPGPSCSVLTADCDDIDPCMHATQTHLSLRPCPDIQLDQDSQTTTTLCPMVGRDRAS